MIGLLDASTLNLYAESELVSKLFKGSTSPNQTKGAGRDFNTENRTTIGSEAIIGGTEPVIIAVTCSIHSEE